MWFSAACSHSPLWGICKRQHRLTQGDNRPIKKEKVKQTNKLFTLKEGLYCSLLLFIANYWPSYMLEYQLLCSYAKQEHHGKLLQMEVSWFSAWTYAPRTDL